MRAGLCAGSLSKSAEGTNVAAESDLFDSERRMWKPFMSVSQRVTDDRARQLIQIMLPRVKTPLKSIVQRTFATRPPRKMKATSIAFLAFCD